MSIKAESIIKAIDTARNQSKHRRFEQSIDLVVTFRDLDIKKPENKFSLTVTLPHPIPNKQNKICMIASGSMVLSARDANVDLVISKDDFPKYVESKKSIRKLAQEYDFFLATPDMMVQIGRTMGSILGPRGKMPDVVQPNADLKPIVDRYRRSVRVKIKDQPQVMARIGGETMNEKEIAENATAVLEEITKKVQPEKIRSIYIKLTMGAPIRLNLQQ
ncbi:50S ribosomal protein L1 [Thermocladium modestius]|uniref:Large ribosomal subunit protein uL1 n=1 Tax=Thermocladium modestius TaxID=62609 RepID=A0A830GWF2_9CREN|nr:50S ribosomal protein L1 [Thermocladium modestius]GGP21110.1 50S ribosomal protein L1 [Thermocladium modestius]